ncbi:methylated-DNA--[protein]-cysteine S-methyltransferase [Tessaracoccus antarcticus]|uniref:Methylated-DNA--[protein]-cysteine S-methyltransferase n=1 Tax=Tessaracoccus antarcticus TaxID=2479848 RepID=A0A3M0GV26_9ACTN|nr:methylated-DNA--[protein]-cysteine S-methyltransferase [Tessaracoccus antarcticus]RMB61176.1 methylated-DNA--[protein]-cysteine S-methyltransferase [Tessaracoccus antarcticus]
MNAYVSTMSTADGPFTIVMVGDDVIASGWTSDVASLLALVHPTLRPELCTLADGGEQDPSMAAALRAVAAYYDGDVEHVAAVSVRQRSGPFRMQAWDVLRAVDAGGPITYAEFAARAGTPSAVRAAAAACARNAAALFVPCHRVLRSDGSLGGFRYGLELKRRLLKRESEAAQPSG